MSLNTISSRKTITKGIELTEFSEYLIVQEQSISNKSRICKKFNFSVLMSSLTLLSYTLTPVAISQCQPFGQIAHVNPTILFQPPTEEEQPEITEGGASRHNLNIDVKKLPAIAQRQPLGLIIS